MYIYLTMCETKARMDGKVVIVTGGSSGIGYETAKNLAYRGAKVILASRNESKLKKSRESIQKATGNKNITYGILDLASLKSVRRFVSEVNTERVDVLINNAGAVALPDRLTEDGLNLTMEVNYFGAFLLTYLLIPLLRKSAPSRVVVGSAASMYIGQIDFDHWNDVGRYNWVESLSNSKLADALFAMELNRRLTGSGITVNSFDPFVVRGTDLLSNAPDYIGDISKPFINIIGQSKEEVGQQIAYLAADPSLEGVGGEHFKFCRRWFDHWLVNDKELGKKLWNLSKNITGITPEDDWES